MLALGAKTISLDDKGRISIPAEYRTPLDKMGVSEFVCTLSGKEYLVLVPRDNWQAVVASIEEHAQPELREALRHVALAHAVVCPIDKQWRVLIPASNRKRVNLNGEIVVFGEESHLQLWPSADWEGRTNAFFDVLRGTKQSLGPTFNGKAPKKG